MSEPLASYNTKRRAILRYFGGKKILAPWIVEHLPEHRRYVEPYGGAASVLIAKPRSYAEVYNDLDSSVAGFFRVLRDPALTARLVEVISYTPYSREEFTGAIEPSDDPVESARRLLVRSHMGFNADGMFSESTYFRDNTMREATIPAHDWRRMPEVIIATAERFRGVIVECRPALEILARYGDDSGTCLYVDPPYPFETRWKSVKGGKGYRHEMTTEDHVALSETLHESAALVVLSGYRCALYDDLYADWRCVERRTRTAQKHARTEVLWFNRAASERLPQDLFTPTDA